MMNTNLRKPNNTHCGTLARLMALSLGIAFASGCHASPSPQLEVGSGSPDLTIGANQYPDDDAIVLRWEQHWSLDNDGTVRRLEHWWVKLFNSRAIGRYADFRIDLNNAKEAVAVTGRTHLMDGTILSVPEYSYNIAAPGDVAGWPEYSDWQQVIVSFSGIEDGCVLELEYEVKTKPGVLPWVAADLQLQNEDSVLERIVTVSVPASTELHWAVDNLPGDSGPRRRTADDGRTEYTWTFKDLVGVPSEPQSPPWQEWCGRLRFTTVKSAAAFCNSLLHAVEINSQPDERIRAFAEEAVGEELGTNEQVEALIGKLRATFNYLNSVKTMQSLQCRPAAEVFQANYGNPLEAGALLAAACRALGLQVEPMVAVDARAWDAEAPADSCFAGIVAVIETEDGPLYAHPQTGLFTNPGTWGRHMLLSLDDAGQLHETYIAARGESQVSRIDVTGRVTLEEDGSAGGELQLKLTGGFYDPAAMDTAAAQQALVSRFVGRLFDGFNVTDCSVTALSGATFSATATVRTTAPLPALNDHRLLTLGDGPVSLGTFPLPLARSARSNDVHLNGAFAEHVDLTFSLPENAAAVIVPVSLGGVSGDWGHLAQSVLQEDCTVRFRRDVRINTDRIDAADFPAIREAVNSLRAEDSRHLLFGK